MVHCYCWRDGLLRFWYYFKEMLWHVAFQHINLVGIYETYWCGGLFVFTFVLGFGIGIGCFMGGCVIWYVMAGIGYVSSSHEEGNHRRR